MTKLEVNLKKELSEKKYFSVDTFNFKFDKANISFIDSNEAFSLLIEDNEITEDNCKEIFYDIIEIVNLCKSIF